MTNDSPGNSLFSLITDDLITDKEFTDEAATGPEPIGQNEQIKASDPHNAPSSEKANSPEAHSFDRTESQSGEWVNQDESPMPHDARRVLVHLMRQGAVMAAQKSKLFELLCRHERVIRKHLSEVYLQLVLDQKSGVAFVASATADYKNDSDNGHPEADPGDGIQDQEDLELEESTTLIIKRTLSLYDTLILLVLRQHYQDRESAGEQKITIDIERLESYLTPFLPITDHASKDRKKLVARVKEMVKRKVLSTIRGTEERYEITPIIRYVVSANFLESMLKHYIELAANQGELNNKGASKQTKNDSNGY